MSKKYKLTTIKDIFDKVPSDRIPVLMAELTDGLVKAKEFEDSLKKIATEVESVWPEFITWHDDGKGEVKINVNMGQK